MPKGPNGEKRPADPIGVAVMIGRFDIGAIEEERETHAQLFDVPVRELGG